MNKPQIVEDWERSMQAIEDMAPKCCWTCCEFSKVNNSCLAHGGEEVPEDFMGEVDQCSSHNRDPF